MSKKEIIKSIINELHSEGIKPDAKFKAHLNKLTKMQLDNILVSRSSNVDIRMSDIIEGSGLFSSIKKFAKKAFSAIKNIGSKGNLYLHNKYRATDCDGKSRPLVEGEYHYGCHNYTGPGTRMDLYPDYKPFNNIDNCSRMHDLAYYNIGKDLNSGKISKTDAAKLVHQADIDAINCYNQFPNEDGYQAAVTGISSKYIGEQIYSEYKGEPSVLYS